MNIRTIIEESIDTKTRLLEDEEIITAIEKSVNICIQAFKTKNKVLLCGNGGSAADAQHIAAELSGRFNFDREPLFAEALHVNSSYLTAVANDYGYTEVFARMVKASGRPGDVLIGISTSGNSENVVLAIEEANKLQMNTIALTGEEGGKLSGLAGICIRVPSANTARIQESHILIGHILCQLIEEKLFA